MAELWPGNGFSVPGAMRFGRVEVRAKLPSVYGYETYARLGNIDIFRSYSGVTSTVYFGGDKETVPFDPSEAYHTYALEVSTSGSKWYVDGALIHENMRTQTEERGITASCEEYGTPPSGPPGRLLIESARYIPS